jgi:polyhydroxybutyrate depolymerase
MLACMRKLFGIVALSIAACGDDSGDTSSSGGGASSSSTADSATSTSAAGGSTTSGATSGGAGGTVNVAKSAGCVDGVGIPEGESTFMLNNVERKYIVHLPAGYTRERTWPVVLALHPNGGTINYWNETSGERNIRGLVGDDAVLIVVEDATNNWPDDLDTELQYFDTILNRAKSELCVNLDEIFSMGFSGGGSFSGVLACRRDDIRAIAIGGAVMYFDPNDCVNTPAAWITIGELELVQARADFRDFWRDKASCEMTSMATDPNPCVAYDGCDAATPVHYCQHTGDHVWPSFGSQAAWNFFQQFIVE